MENRKKTPYHRKVHRGNQKNALETEEQNNNKNKYYNNLTQRERKALKELVDRIDIIITKADKGGAVANIDVEDYVKEAEHRLSNKTLTKSFHMNQHKHTKDWLMTQ